MIQKRFEKEKKVHITKQVVKYLKTHSLKQVSTLYPNFTKQKLLDMKKHPEKYMCVDFKKVFNVFESIQPDAAFLELLRLLNKFSLSDKVKSLKSALELNSNFDEKVLARMLYQASTAAKDNKELKGFAWSMCEYLDKWFKRYGVDDVWKEKKVFSLEICKEAKTFPILEKRISAWIKLMNSNYFSVKQLTAGMRRILKLEGKLDEQVAEAVKMAFRHCKIVNSMRKDIQDTSHYFRK